MATVVVSIGNRTAPRYGGNELAPQSWATFKDRVRDALRGAGFRTIYVDGAEAFGEWEGLTEVSATWVAASEGFSDVETLKGALAFWSDEFWQDAIAVTVGETELVSGRTVFQ